MTTAEKLMLSFFDETIGKEFKDEDATAEMISAGIGSNSASPFPYYDLIHTLKSKGLLTIAEDRTPLQTKIRRSTGRELIKLTKTGAELVNRVSSGQKHHEFVTELELKKSKSEYDLQLLQLADYHKTKRQSNWALAISIISALAAVLALLKN